jgi:hypothetical protein
MYKVKDKFAWLTSTAKNRKTTGMAKHLPVVMNKNRTYENITQTDALGKRSGCNHALLSGFRLRRQITMINLASKKSTPDKDKIKIVQLKVSDVQKLFPFLASPSLN